MPEPKIIHVAAAALFDADGRVLVQEHLKPRWHGHYEFPGGRIEVGETPEQALARELREELGIEICVPCLHPLGFSSYTYDDIGHVVILLFTCRKYEGMPLGLSTGLDGQALKWVRPPELRGLPLLPSNHIFIELVERA